MISVAGVMLPGAVRARADFTRPRMQARGAAMQYTCAESKTAMNKE